MWRLCVCVRVCILMMICVCVYVCMYGDVLCVCLHSSDLLDYGGPVLYCTVVRGRPALPYPGKTDMHFLAWHALRYDATRCEVIFCMVKRCRGDDT